MPLKRSADVLTAAVPSYVLGRSSQIRPGKVLRPVLGCTFKHIINLTQRFLQKVMPVASMMCCCFSVAQLCPTLCNPMDCSPPGSSVHRISQARILEWVAISFFMGVFPAQGWNPCLLHWQADFSPLSHLILYNASVNLLPMFQTKL